MAEFITTCPHCDAELQAQDEWIGMEVECPLCHKMFAINKSSAQVETEKTEAVINSALAADEKNCPFCNGIIKEQAIFCKHCKTDLNKTTTQTQVESLFIFICPECDTAMELPESMKDKEYECPCCCETSIAREAVERNCPSCGEKIKIKATVCKHCKQKVLPLVKYNQQTTMNDEKKTSVLPLNADAVVVPEILSEEKVARINKFNKIVYIILIFMNIIAWFIGIICCFVKPDAALVIFVIITVLTLIITLILPKERIILDEGEYIIGKTRLVEQGSVKVGINSFEYTEYFVRLTNKRMILSNAAYPFLPVFIIAIFSKFREPVDNVVSFNIEDITYIESTVETGKIKGPFGVKTKYTRPTLTLQNKEENLKFIGKVDPVIVWWKHMKSTEGC